MLRLHISRSSRVVTCQAVTSVLLTASLLAQTDSLPIELRAAGDALSAGNVAKAIDQSQRYVWSHPQDPKGFLILGDAYAARMPDGRFRAIDAYTAARRLTPNDPDPVYRLAQMGLRLGGADGERIAGDNLERVLKLDPLYMDAWDEWLTLYRNAGGRRKMIDLLSPHRDNSIVRARIAQLLIEEERYGEADRLLDSSLVVDSTNVAWLALRSESALEAGDTIVGLRFYRRALANAPLDSTDALWRQVLGIATPDEIRMWVNVPSSEKGFWIENFWARRNPNLFAVVNDRIVSHFARLRYARKHYPLMFPLGLYQRSSIARTLNLEPSQAEREWHLRCEVYQALAPPTSGLDLPLPGVSDARELARVSPGAYSTLTSEEKEALHFAASNRRDARAQQALRDPFAFSPAVFTPLGLDLRDVDTAAARVGYNLSTGLDDRGIMYLRFGPPEAVKYGGDNTLDPRCNTTEVERWSYSAWGEARFARPAGLSAGARNVSEEIFRPMNERQFEAMRLGLTRDAPSEPAPLDFGVWLAQFRDQLDSTHPDLVVISTRGELAARLVGMLSGDGTVRRSDGGALMMPAAPGNYVLLAHARVGDSLGRLSLDVRLRSFDSLPAMSDLLLFNSNVGDSIDRSNMLDRVQRDLTFGHDDAVRVYAELYGLTPVGNRVRYEATYRLLRTTDPRRDVVKDVWPDATVIRFDREQLFAPGLPVKEAVNVRTWGINPGQYVLRLEIVDKVANKSLGRATIAFRAR